MKTEIEEIRTTLGLSQAGFAKLIGWTQATVSRLETGASPIKKHHILAANAVVALAEEKAAA